ncbi:hypothetical protein FHT00_000923 [Sphingomonas insulae]|nr:hypothetical protein [Sphingomonas insulae]
MTYVGRFGRSATWTAPPPINAPPHAQAHNFANAIRTDITSLSRCRRHCPGRPVRAEPPCYGTKCKTNH